MNGAGARFFAAVRAAAAERLSADHPCTQALERAAGDGDPVLAAAAEDELRRLQPAVMTEIMGAAHKLLREDGAAILEQWPGRASGRPA